MLWQDRRSLRLGCVWLSMLAGLIWIVYLFVNSPGVPVHDELGHYFFSRDSWHDPKLILHFWGRTVNTLVYMPGAFYGLAWARVTSILMAFATAALALALARKLDVRYAFLVPLLVWFQPWYADLSYACITEVPFSLVLAGGAVLLVSEHTVSASFVLGLLPLVRHEGILLVGLCVLYCLLKRNWRAAAAALTPLVVYNLIYFMVQGRWAFLQLYSQTKPTEFYGSGTWSHMVVPMVTGIGLPVFFLAANALVPVVRSKRRLLVFSFYAAYLAVHVVIYRFGMYGSGGYGLFLLPLAPAAAVAAALGLEFIVTHATPALEAWGVSGNRQLHVRYAFLGACVLAVLVIGFETTPRPLEVEAVLMKQAADWIHEQGLDRGRIITSHAWFHYFMPDRTERPPKQTSPDQIPRDAVVVWDSHYSERCGLPFKELYENRRDWALLKVFGRGRVVVFQKRTD